MNDAPRTGPSTLLVALGAAALTPALKALDAVLHPGAAPWFTGLHLIDLVVVGCGLMLLRDRRDSAQSGAIGSGLVVGGLIGLCVGDVLTLLLVAGAG